MELIEFDGLELKITDKALLVRPIRELFQKDKSKKKEEFWKQISYLWFMCDPRSPYMFLLDEDERADEIKAQEGLGKDWIPSELLKEAMSIYSRQCTTTQSLLIEDMRYGLESIRRLIRRIGKEMNAEDTDDGGGTGSSLKLDKALDAMTKAVDKIPELAKKLADAEKALAKDFATDDKARGNTSKAVGEDI